MSYSPSGPLRPVATARALLHALLCQSRHIPVHQEKAVQARRCGPLSAGKCCMCFGRLGVPLSADTSVRVSWGFSLLKLRKLLRLPQGCLPASLRVPVPQKGRVWACLFYAT